MINPDKRKALEKFGAILLVAGTDSLTRAPEEVVPGNWKSLECDTGTVHYLPPAAVHRCADGSILAYLGSPFRAAMSQDELTTSLESATQSATRGFSPVLEHFDGQFCAFSLLPQQAQASCATDRIGSRAVYWYKAEKGSCAAASDLDLLRACTQQGKPEICKQAIYNYIFHHCIPSPLTAFEGYFKMGPASCLNLGASQPHATQWWLPDFSNQDRDDKNGLMRRLRQTLSEAVRAAASRYPEGTGAFLSGGLDSSTVAGLLAETSAPQKATTFSIGFDEPDYDERAWARITAKRFDTRQIEFEVSPSDIAPALQKAAAYYAEPFGNSSVIPTYYCAKLALENGFTHLLAGDGGDELYAGNDRYAKQKLFQIWWSLPGFLQSLAQLPFKVLPPLKSVPLLRKVWRYIEQARVPLPDRLQSYNFLVQFEPEEVFSDAVFSSIDTEYPFKSLRQRYDEISNANAIDRMLYLDWKFTLADNDLMKVTQMCHLAGVDVSYPMLDAELLKLSEDIPAQWKLPRLKLRDFYKQTFRDFLAPETINKPKHGFGLPFGVWLKTNEELKNLAEKSLLHLKTRGLFRDEFIEKALHTHAADAAASYYGELVWILMMLELWLHNHE